MMSIDEQISASLPTSRLKRLLSMEKKRRGTEKDSLVFIGVYNLAAYFWCGLNSYYKSLEEEFKFFATYVTDRLRYSLTFGLASNIPTTDSEVLTIGDELHFDHLEDLLSIRKKSSSKLGIITLAQDVVDPNGKRKRILNPFLDDNERDAIRSLPDSHVTETGNINRFPFLRGKFYQESKAEKYPTIRWNFPYKQFVVVGVPDGITDTFVYEFKVTRNKFLFSFLKPVALMQADIYGYFFQRTIKRVQIFITEENRLETFEEEVNKQKVEQLLDNYRKLISGWVPPKPRQWKCKNCSFRERCNYCLSVTKSGA